MDIGPVRRRLTAEPVASPVPGAGRPDERPAPAADDITPGHVTPDATPAAPPVPAERA